VGVSPFTAGLRLHDRFVLVERIGVGGMAQVWRATDEVLGRPVAVKVLAAELASDPGLREATWREARAAARLTHPNVTRVYDYGEAPLPGGGAAPYVVMELVEGENLASRLAGGALPWPEAARIGAYVAAALAAAHELGVVHHDIKPGNVMLTSGAAKVLDFGTAALVGAIDHDVLVGTPSYTAPERLEWAPAQPASDVYSLGVLLYEALTGDPPAALDSWDEAAAAHRAGRGPRRERLPDEPAELGELVAACLAADPARRPPAREVAGRLARLAGMPDPAASIAAEPPTVVGPRRAAKGLAAGPVPRTIVDERMPEPPAGGYRLMLAGLAVAVVVLGLVVLLAVMQPSGETPEVGAPGPVTSTERPTSAPGSTPPAPVDARAALDELDRAIRDARGAGLLDQGTAQKLRDKVRDVVRELDKPNEDPDGQAEKVREKADKLWEEIAKLEEEGEVPESVAAEFRTLLAAVSEQG
jgi:serine/threonine-protein kinase